ncbi:MAG: hypothetical protein ACOYKJ_00155 [Candidatus Howiella sp.]
MDDLAKQLTSLIESPEGADLIKALTSGLLSGGTEDSSPAPSVPPPPPAEPEGEMDLSGLLSGMPGLPMGELGAFLKIGNILKSAQEDDRARLLLALRPLLSPERQERVDKAVKLMKILQILPLLKETGLDLF